MNTRLLMLLLCAQFGAGCSSVTIEAKDKVNFANLETSVAIGKNDSMRLRFRGADASGEFDQSLDDGERIRINDTRIGGPARIDGEIDLAYYSIAVGLDDRPAGAIAQEWINRYYFGIARTDFDLTLKNEGERNHESDSSVELYAQYGLDYAVSETLVIGFSAALSFGDEASGISEIDLMAEYQILRHLRLYAGYRWLNYSYGDAYEWIDDDSDLEVDFRGPVFGLNFPF